MARFNLKMCGGGGFLVLMALNVACAEEAYSLGRIEVIAAEEVDSNSVVSTISSSDIANSSSSDIAEALRYVPGVFYQPPAGGRGEPSIAVRGYSITHIGLFVDGIPVHSIYDRQTDWAQFSSLGVSEIALSKGYTSPIYGMNTLGGAVNVITSKPKEKLEITARYGFVSNNENQVFLSVGSNTGKMYYQVNYAYTDRDSLNLSNHFTTTQLQPSKDKVNSNYTNHTLRAKVGFEPNQNHEYSLNFIYQKGEKGGMIGANGTSANLWNWPNYDKITAYILGNSQLTDMISLNSKIYYDNFDNKLQVVGAWNGSSIMATNWAGAAINPSRPYTSHYDDYSLGGIFTLGFDFDKDKNLKVGVNLKQDNHTDKTTSWNANNQFVETNEELRDLSTSVFAEYSQIINSIFRVSLNGSYDRNDFISAKTEKDTSLRHLQGWTLQGIVYATLNDYTTLYGNIGKKSKLPTLKDRFGSIWGRRASNSDITPESAINYELGSLFEYHKTKASIAVFYNDINNMLISVATANDTCPNGSQCSRLENAKEGYAYGVEVGVQQGFLDDMASVGANYSYIQKKATNSNGSSYGVDGSRILDYPNHIFNASLILSPIRQIDVIGLATFQSKQWHTEGSGNNISYAQNHDVFLVDAKVNYRPIQSLQFSLGAYNLLDRNYYYDSGYYMAGRRIMANIEYRF